MFPADVPVHRASVGAMALSAPPVPARRPYVYGASPLRLRPEPWRHNPQAEVEADWDKPKPKPTEERKREVAKMKREAQKRRHAKRIEEQERARAEYEQRYAAWQQRLVEEKAMHEAARQAAAPRPAPGWQPMKGADIDDLLNELEQA